MTGNIGGKCVGSDTSSRPDIFYDPNLQFPAVCRNIFVQFSFSKLGFCCFDLFRMVAGQVSKSSWLAQVREKRRRVSLSLFRYR